MTMRPEEIVAILNRDLHLLYDSQPPTPLREALAHALQQEVEALRMGAPVGRYFPWAEELLHLVHGRSAGPHEAALREALAAFRAAQALLEEAECAFRRVSAGQVSTRHQRHREVYATPHLPPMNLNWIDHGLLAGRNPLTELDARWLRARGVTHVLDLREEWEWEPPRFGREALASLEPPVIRRHIPVVDMGAPTPAQLDAAVAFLEEALQAPGSLVYVHCRAGAERTAAVLVAFHARRHGLGYDAALQELRSRRPALNPLPAQEAAVRRWLGR